MESLLAKLISVFQGVDSTFSLLLVLSIVLFLGGEIAWWLKSRAGVPGLPSDDFRLKFIWSLVPALVLVVLLFVHSPRVPSTRVAESGGKRPAIQRVSVPSIQAQRPGGA